MAWTPWLRVFVEGVVIVCARHGAVRRRRAVNREAKAEREVTWG